MGQKSSEHTGGACKMEHVGQRTRLCKCEHHVGWEQGKDKDQEDKGFCVESQALL